MTRVESWLSRPPREMIPCGDLVIRRYVDSDAGSLATSVADSFDHLRTHMAWTRHGVPTAEDERSIIADWDVAWLEHREFAMGVFEGDTIVGSTGFHVRNGAGTLEIGYWVASSRTNEGIATRVTRALTVEAFSIGEVERVVVYHDSLNVASGRIPAKLGFVRVAEHDRSGHPLFATVDRAEGDGDVVVEWCVTRAQWDGSKDG